MAAVNPLTDLQENPMYQQLVLPHAGACTDEICVCTRAYIHEHLYTASYQNPASKNSIYQNPTSHYPTYQNPTRIPAASYQNPTYSSRIPN